jgi:hypothetical protein
MSRFAVTFDYLCPFARNANEIVIHAQDDGGPADDVEWRAFSLSQVHLEEGATPVWAADPLPSGVLALQWGLAVRDQFPERFPATHLAIFSARHDQGRDLNDPRVVRDAVASAGLDPDEVAKVVAEGGPAEALAGDHTWGVEEHRVFGVPTFIAGERAVFVRLMHRPEDAASARVTLDRVLDMMNGWADLNEFKATRIPR